MRQKDGEKTWVEFIVSIHASVKDATDPIHIVRIVPDVSIHASVKDATEISLGVECLVVVSIHASVKDATTSQGRF